jgi:hypothetical protein
MGNSEPDTSRPSQESLPVEVREFVQKHISSVAELEALLLLRQPITEYWTAAPLAGRLYVSEAAAAEVLDALFQRGFLIASSERYRFAPAAEELRAGLDAVALAYPRFLIPITDLIHARPVSAPQRFADAFRVRNREKE